MKMEPVDGDDSIDERNDGDDSGDVADRDDAGDVAHGDEPDVTEDEATGGASGDEGHPFDVASQEADDSSNVMIPPVGRIDIVAEPVRYRRGPVYALLAIAVLPALGLLWVHRWAEDEADRYDAEVARLEAERSLPPVPGEAKETL